MSTNLVPVMKPKLPKYRHVKKYLKQIDKNQIYSNNGPLIKELEQKYANFLGIDSDQVVLCSSATAGLIGTTHLSEADEINVPTFTFPASALAVSNAGKKLVLQDIDNQDWQIDVSNISNGSSNGIMVVLPFGAEWRPNKYLAFDNVIFDAAASLGNLNSDLKSLKKNWSIVFSLHATKVLGIGEGGLVVFGDPDKAQAFRAWINFGFAGTRESTVKGMNAKMSEVQAAYGLATLDSWRLEKAEWLKARKLTNQIKTSKFLNNFMNDIQISPYWIVELKNAEERKKLEKIFNRHKIETRSWWSAVHKMSAFAEFNRNSYVVADSISERTLGLPFFRNLKKLQLNRINAAISEFNRYE